MKGYENERMHSPCCGPKMCEYTEAKSVWSAKSMERIFIMRKCVYRVEDGLGGLRGFRIERGMWHIS